MEHSLRHLRGACPAGMPWSAWAPRPRWSGAPVCTAGEGRSRDTNLTAFAPHATARVIGPLRFSDESGAEVSLAGFQGRVVLLNVWATWCPPCREEMPTLDRLQASLGGPQFEVVTVSIDVDGLLVARQRREAARSS